jgi:hypothetical protein
LITCALGSPTIAYRSFSGQPGLPELLEKIYFVIVGCAKPVFRSDNRSTNEAHIQAGWFRPNSERGERKNSCDR